MIMTVGDRLRLARKRVGLTPETVAVRIGQTPGSVRHHENGQREPDIKTIAQYARMYKVTTDWIILGVGPGPGDATGEALDTWRDIPIEQQPHALDVLRTFRKKNR